jgi:hypothetical protein
VSLTITLTDSDAVRYIESLSASKPAAAPVAETPAPVVTAEMPAPAAVSKRRGRPAATTPAAPPPAPAAAEDDDDLFGDTPAPAAKEYTRDDLLKALMDLKNAKSSEAARNVLEKVGGAPSVSALDKSKYGAVIEAAIKAAAA